MATRQYIGARYVPKFFSGEGGSTDWVSGIPYEALTIVTYLGNSFTSKKPVPVGIDITDTHYWVATGTYNSQIEELRQALVETDETVEAIQSDYVIKHKKILIVGDSYLDRTPSYGSYLQSIYDDADIILKGEAGAGFTHFSTLGEKTFEGILTTYANTLTDAEKSSFTDVIVLGGSNDRGQSSSVVETAVATFFNIARTNFVNARMHLGFLGWTGFSSTYQSADKLSFLAMKDVYKDCCYSNNLKWIENINYIMHDYSHYADEGHPDNVASERIAKFLFDYLQNGYASVHIITNATFTLNTNMFNVGQFDSNIEKISCEIINGVTRFAVNGGKPNFRNYGKISFTVSGLTANGDMAILGTLAGGGVFGIENNDSCQPVLTPIPVRVYKNGSVQFTFLEMFILHGSLSFIYYNGLFEDWSDVSNIIIPAFELTVPTDYA